jgi:hypothetical protein
MSVAYLDPGSGSIIASVLVGGVAGVGVAASRAKARLGLGRKRKQQSSESSADASSARQDAGEPASPVDATSD